MTRTEFLKAVAYSRAVRIVLALGVIVLFAMATPVLWELRIFIALIVLAFAIRAADFWWFASARRRQKMLNEQRLSDAHWAYGFRWMMWTGLAMAVGQLDAYLRTGIDQTKGLTISGIMCIAGALAHLVWAFSRAKAIEDRRAADLHRASE